MVTKTATEAHDAYTVETAQIMQTTIKLHNKQKTTDIESHPKE